MAGHYWLSDICQQRIDIVATKNGKTMFSQTSVVVAKDKFSDIGSCLCGPRKACCCHALTCIYTATAPPWPPHAQLWLSGCTQMPAWPASGSGLNKALGPCLPAQQQL